MIMTNNSNVNTFRKCNHMQWDGARPPWLHVKFVEIGWWELSWVPILIRPSVSSDWFPEIQNLLDKDLNPMFSSGRPLSDCLWSDLIIIQIMHSMHGPIDLGVHCMILIYKNNYIKEEKFSLGYCLCYTDLGVQKEAHFLSEYFLLW